MIGVIGQLAFSAVGVCTAIREAGKTGEIIVVGRDRDAATLELIENGELATSFAQNSFVEGYIALMWLHDYAAGNLKVINDYLGAGINPLPNIVDSGSIVIDKSNYKQFLGPYTYTVTAKN
jgi:ribose transport system substrate-binding protein